MMNMSYYLYWIFFVHGFTAFLIDYLLIGTFSYSESSFSYMVFNQNLYLTSFSVIFFLFLVIVMGLFVFFILFRKSSSQKESDYILNHHLFTSDTVIFMRTFESDRLKDFRCFSYYLENRRLRKRTNLRSFPSWKSNYMNMLWSLMNNLLFFGFIFDSSSSYSQTFFKYFFLIWNSFF